MEKIAYTLDAEPRDVLGKNVAELRAEGIIPAVVYGPGAENQNISLNARSFEKLYREAGESNLVTLTIAGEPSIKVLIHDVQDDPVTNRTLHADFYRVNMKEKLTAHIPLVFIGESKAAKEQGGILVKHIDEVEVRCLPDNLVPEIPVRVDVLDELEDTIAVKDIVLPPGIELLHHAPNDIVVIVAPPITEEKMKKMEEEGAAQAPAAAEKTEETK